MPAPEVNSATNPEQVEDQPPREVSQTDHINKKLLTSLFKRMDEGGDLTLNKMLEPENKEIEDDEWKD